MMERVIMYQGANRSERSAKVSVRSPRIEVIPDFAELWSYRYVAAILVWRDIKVRFSHSFLGILWYVIQPFLLMLVIAIGFRFVMPKEVNGLPYPVFVASGLILWQYFSNALMSGASSFEKFQAIINKAYVPKLALPIAGITASLADLLAASFLLVPLMMYYKVFPSWRIIFIPIVILGVVLLVGGLVLFLSVAWAKYKDVRYILPFATQVLFFASPIFVPQNLMPESAIAIFRLNPLAGYLDLLRWVLFADVQPPEPGTIVLAISISVCLLAIGLIYFQRRQGDLIDVI